MLYLTVNLEVLDCLISILHVLEADKVHKHIPQEVVLVEFLILLVYVFFQFFNLLVVHLFSRFQSFLSD